MFYLKAELKIKMNGKLFYQLLSKKKKLFKISNQI